MLVVLVQFLIPATIMITGGCDGAGAGEAKKGRTTKKTRQDAEECKDRDDRDKRKIYSKRGKSVGFKINDLDI